MDVWPVYVGLSSASAAVSLAASIDAWRHRKDTAMAGPAAVVTLGLAWWAATDTLQALLPDGRLRELTVTGVLLGMSLVTGAFFYGAVGLVRANRPPGRRWIAVLAIHPVVVVLITLVEPWRRHVLTFVESADRSWLPWRPEAPLLVLAGYGYVLVGCGLGLLLRTLRTSTSPLRRRQLGLVFLAAAIPTVGNAVVLIRSGGLVSPDAMPVFALASVAIYSYAVLRQGLLRLLPVARELVLETVSDAVFVVDPAGTVIDVNPAGTRLARRLDADLPTCLIGLPGDRVLPATRYRRALTDGEYHLEQPDGMIDLDLRISELTDGHGSPLGRVVVVRDVTEINDQRRLLADINGRLVEQLHVIDRLRHELAELAVRDELTGLYNRRYLIAQLEVDLERARCGAAPLSLVLLDVDHFKSVNDRFGHPVGDDLLVTLGRALAAGLRSDATVARYGGEEFVVLLPGAGLREAIAWAEALRARCSTALVDTPSGPISTTVSAGVAAFPECGWTSTDLLQSADDALYAAKSAGRDRVVAADPWRP